MKLLLVYHQFLLRYNLLYYMYKELVLLKNLYFIFKHVHIFNQIINQAIYQNMGIINIFLCLFFLFYNAV